MAILSAIAGMAILFAACSTSTPEASPTEARGDTAARGEIARPIVGGWMYMADDQDYNTIPADWSNISFADMNVLNIGPLGVQEDGNFGIYQSEKTGDLANRLKWIMKTAREQNPDIRIVVSQWWNSSPKIWGSSIQKVKTKEQIATYADSVAAFVKSYLDVSGGIDGYDIDYEGDNVGPQIGGVLSGIRAQLDELSKAEDGRKFSVTASPAGTSNLKGTAPVVDYLNMQTYEGGAYTTVSDYEGVGYQSSQLVYGLCPETDCSPAPTFDDAKTAYTNDKLAGLFVWRLNSDNYVDEGKVQKQAFDFLYRAG